MTCSSPVNTANNCLSYDDTVHCKICQPGFALVPDGSNPGTFGCGYPRPPIAHCLIYGQVQTDAAAICTYCE